MRGTAAHRTPRWPLAGSLSRRKLLHAPVNCKFSTQRLARRSWDVEVGAIKVCLADVQVEAVQQRPRVRVFGVWACRCHELHEALDRTGSARWLSPLAPGSPSLSLPLRLRDNICLQPAACICPRWPLASQRRQLSPLPLQGPRGQDPAQTKVAVATSTSCLKPTSSIAPGGGRGTRA